MTNNELKTKMTKLFNILEQETNDEQKRQVIAEAVQLGMTYQEQMIQEGIKTVFHALHMKQ